MSEDTRHGPKVLAAHAGAFVTSVGGAFPGTRAVFRGRDLHTELLPRMGWFGLCALGLCGRELSDEQLRLLEFFWVCSSYPDARIWNNRVVALAGTTRSTANLGLAAAHAVSEATIYGRRNEYRAVAFFQHTLRDMREGRSLADCIERYEQRGLRLAGYGRPLASGDERIAPTMAKARELGLAGGPHVALAFDVERHLKAAGRPLQMNYGALVAAFGADFGLTPREFTMLLFPCFLAGMHPCYVEALAKPERAVFAMPCSQVSYEGELPRPWPSGDAVPQA